MSDPDVSRSDKQATPWQECPISTCQRHQACVYTPCRHHSARASPTTISDRIRLGHAAKIIDRLLILIPDRHCNAVDDALRWLIEHDGPGVWLSDATRDRMNNFGTANNSKPFQEGN